MLWQAGWKSTDFIAAPRLHKTAIGLQLLFLAACVLAWQRAMHKSVCTGRCWQRHGIAPPGWVCFPSVSCHTTPHSPVVRLGCAVHGLCGIHPSRFHIGGLAGRRAEVAAGAQLQAGPRERGLRCGLCCKCAMAENVCLGLIHMQLVRQSISQLLCCFGLPAWHCRALCVPQSTASHQ